MRYGLGWASLEDKKDQKRYPVRAKVLEEGAGQAGCSFMTIK